MKNLWRGAFNYRQSAEILYSYACSKAQARVIFCRRMAVKSGVHPSVVLGLFDGSRDNFTIKIETEFMEANNAND
jgi:hypothetical protein